MNELRSFAIRVWRWAKVPTLAKSFVMMFTFFAILHYLPNSFRRQYDPYLLATLGIVFTYLMFNMIRETNEWTIRSLGIFFTFLGDGLLYLSVSMPKWDIHFPAWSIDLARAAFVTAILHLIVGAVDYERHRKHD